MAHDLGAVTEGLRGFLVEGAGRRRGPDEIVDHLWGLMAGGLFYVTMEYLPEARHNAPFRERLLPVVQEFHAALDALWLSVSDAHGLDPLEARVTLNATLCLMRGMVAQSVLRPDEDYFASMLDHWKAHLLALFAAPSGPRAALDRRPASPPMS
ncbi:TetR/AcrR family transcriptional regulator [Lichenibacterium minor]|uniref:TetR/AcrR family transcriptional regulator n=1 Tax=Lichenibacterium minor TaxID=2316528 RepID=UPI001FE14B85|nr:TetR/AcrR family transcriptional regulator [Lichenibacterium minor]